MCCVNERVPLMAGTALQQPRRPCACVEAPPVSTALPFSVDSSRYCNEGRAAWHSRVSLAHVVPPLPFAAVERSPCMYFGSIYATLICVIHTCREPSQVCRFGLIFTLVDRRLHRHRRRFRPEVAPPRAWGCLTTRSIGADLSRLAA